MCPPSSVSAPPSVCWTAFPRSPASILTSPRARSCSFPVPMARARPRCCASSRGSCRSTPVKPWCSTTTLPAIAAVLAATSRSWATRPFAMTTSRCGRTCASRLVPPDATPRAADAALERVGLVGARDVVHRRLSAGQRRRLALAVAWSRDPRLLLLDEPHAGLDAEGRAVLDEIVRAAPSGRPDRAHRIPRARPRPRALEPRSRPHRRAGRAARAASRQRRRRR